MSRGRVDRYGATTAVRRDRDGFYCCEEHNDNNKHSVSVTLQPPVPAIPLARGSLQVRGALDSSIRGSTCLQHTDLRPSCAKISNLGFEQISGGAQNQNLHNLTLVYAAYQRNWYRCENCGIYIQLSICVCLYSVHSCSHKSACKTSNSTHVASWCSAVSVQIDLRALTAAAAPEREPKASLILRTHIEIQVRTETFRSGWCRQQCGQSLNILAFQGHK